VACHYFVQKLDSIGVLHFVVLHQSCTIQGSQFFWNLDIITFDKIVHSNIGIPFNFFNNVPLFGLSLLYKCIRTKVMIRYSCSNCFELSLIIV
jgi:hypothetical protein